MRKNKNRNSRSKAKTKSQEPSTSPSYIDINIGTKEHPINLRVIFHSVVDGQGHSMTRIEAIPCPQKGDTATIRKRRLGRLMAAHLMLVYGKLLDEGKLSSVEQQEAIRFVALLEMGIAFRARESAVCFKEVSKKVLSPKQTANPGVYNKLNDSLKELADNPMEQLKLTLRETPLAESEVLYDHAESVLLGKAPDPEWLRQYDKFEYQLINAWCKIKNDPQYKDFDSRRKALHDHIKNLGKDGDSEMRGRLNYFQAACDTAYASAHQLLMSAVVSHPDVLKRLDSVSLEFNRLIHAMQPLLGGLVLALHPIMGLILRYPEILSLIRNYCSKDEVKRLSDIEKLNGAFVAVFVFYKALLDVEDEEVKRSVEEEYKENQATGQVPLPSHQTLKSLKECIGKALLQDPDVLLWLEKEENDLTYDELGKKHGHDRSWAYKRAEAGRKKILEQVAAKNITPADLQSEPSFQPSSKKNTLNSGDVDDETHWWERYPRN